MDLAPLRERVRRLGATARSAWRRLAPRLASLGWSILCLLAIALFAFVFVIGVSKRLTALAAMTALLFGGWLAWLIAGGLPLWLVVLSIAATVAWQLAAAPAWSAWRARLAVVAESHPAARALHLRLAVERRWLVAWLLGALLLLAAWSRFGPEARRISVGVVSAELMTLSAWLAVSLGRLERRLKVAWFTPGLGRLSPEGLESRLVQRLPQLASAQAWRLAAAAALRPAFGGLATKLMRRREECAD